MSHGGCGSLLLGGGGGCISNCVGRRCRSVVSYRPVRCHGHPPGIRGGGDRHAVDSFGSSPPAIVRVSVGSTVVAVGIGRCPRHRSRHSRPPPPLGQVVCLSPGPNCPRDVRLEQSRRWRWIAAAVSDCAVQPHASAGPPARYFGTDGDDCREGPGSRRRTNAGDAGQDPEGCAGTHRQAGRQGGCAHRQESSATVVVVASGTGWRRTRDSSSRHFHCYHPPGGIECLAGSCRSALLLIR
mmetsp:Transcript_31954/g.93971  ORF Transcript_31954/g.93971 Transcript_31954/m.93971 type:complete len:240 (-) Transcript_31954:3846-4565(-)